MRQEDKANKKCSRFHRSIFFIGTLRKGGHPQEQSFLRKILPTYFLMMLHYNCHFHPHHYYYGFQAIELLIP
jgi:hypothetical protein